MTQLFFSKPLLRNEKVKWRTDFFLENMFMGQNYPRIEAVRSKYRKYIRYFAKEKDRHHVLSLVAPLLGEKPIYEELYDLQNDLLEKHNVANNPRNKSVLEKCRKSCVNLSKNAKGDSKLPDTHI